jgi:hypothetical protein
LHISNFMTDLVRSTSAVMVPGGAAWFALGMTGVALALTLGGSSSVAPASLTLGRVASASTVSSSYTSSQSTSASRAHAQRREVSAGASRSGSYFLFQLDGAPYLRIDDLEDAAAAKYTRTPLRMASRDGKVGAYAPLTDVEVPAPYRGWIGREVVAGASCRAKVTGLAIVSQLVGEAAYADLDGDWTPETVFENGSPILAARLDGCGGELLARDAARGSVVIPERLDHPKLVQSAKRTLLSSPAAAQAETRWSEGGGRGRWRDGAAFDVRVLRHPGTQVTWVVAFARNQVDDCGLPETNLLGIYRVNGAGKLMPVTSRLVSELHELEAVIDLEDDGQLELIGKPWLGYDRLVTDGKGEVVDRLEMPFYGCPC